MELAALGSAAFFATRMSEVPGAARQARFRRLLVVLVVVAVPVVGADGRRRGPLCPGQLRRRGRRLPLAPPRHPVVVPALRARGSPRRPVAVVLAAAADGGPLAPRPLPARGDRHDAGRRRRRGGVVEEVVKTLNLFLAHRTFSERMGGTPARADAVRRAARGQARPTSPRRWRPRRACRSCSCRRRPSSRCTTGRPTARYVPISGRCSAYARREGGAIGFIEEIDAIGAARGGLGAGPGREGIAGVVNELLIQLQSFDVPPLGRGRCNAVIDAVNRWLPASRTLHKRVVAPANVLVIGATNRASDLDPALLRPGRFDRTIRVDVPPGRAPRDHRLLPGPQSPQRRARRARQAGRPGRLDLRLFARDARAPLRRGAGVGAAGRTGSDELGRRPAGADDRGARAWPSPVIYTRGGAACHRHPRSGPCHRRPFRRPRPQPRRPFHHQASRGPRLVVALGRRGTFHPNPQRVRGAMLQIAMGGMVAEEMFFGEAGTGPPATWPARPRLAAQMVGPTGWRAA